MYHSKSEFKLGEVPTEKVIDEIYNGMLQNRQDNMSHSLNKFYNPSYWCGSEIDYVIRHLSSFIDNGKGSSEVSILLASSDLNEEEKNNVRNLYLGVLAKFGR